MNSLQALGSNGRKKERARERETRARSFLRPLLPSACYAGYFMKYAQVFSPYIKIHKVARKRCNLGDHRSLSNTAFSSWKRNSDKHVMQVEIDMETNEASTQRNEYSKLDKTRGESKNTIVIRGDWLWKATTIKLNIKTQCRLWWKLREGAKSFVFYWQIVTE